MIVLLHLAGRWSQTSSGPYGLFSRNVAPVAPRRRARRSARGSSNWWHATKSASLDQVRRADRRGPKRRCETVIAPDFFES